MYGSGDVLAHFKGVCAFLEIDVQHVSCQKEETIFCPCKVCKNVVIFKDREVIHEHLVRSGFMDNYFIWTKHGETQLGTETIIVERVEENMGTPDNVCSHHDD
jgi:nitrite reductase/ring-hydroxylating ferredoxin subunit